MNPVAVGGTLNASEVYRSKNGQPPAAEEIAAADRVAATQQQGSGVRIGARRSRGAGGRRPAAGADGGDLPPTNRLSREPIEHA